MRIGVRVTITRDLSTDTIAVHSADAALGAPSRTVMALAPENSNHPDEVPHFAPDHPK
jgi:hypothetical protein